MSAERRIACAELDQLIDRVAAMRCLSGEICLVIGVLPLSISYVIYVPHDGCGFVLPAVDQDSARTERAGTAGLVVGAGTKQPMAASS